MTTDLFLAFRCDKGLGVNMQIKREGLLGEMWVSLLPPQTWKAWKGHSSTVKASWAPPGGRKEVRARAHVEGRSAWRGALPRGHRGEAHWPWLPRQEVQQGGKGNLQNFFKEQDCKEKQSPDFLKPGILKSFRLQSWTLKCSFNNCTLDLDLATCPTRGHLHHSRQIPDL